MEERRAAMTGYVVDASVFGPFLFDDETDALSPNLTDILADGECIVPQHWWLEVTNQLLMGLRRDRTRSEIAAALLADVELLPITTDSRTGEQFRVTFALAERHGLTVYDAAYLELTLRSEATLISYDGKLRTAALAEGLKIEPEA
jgi:predicted nucleic acid-binding protein